MTRNLKPPATIACNRVLEYAILDEPVRYSGHSNLFRGDEEVGPVACLAICEDLKRNKVVLLHCDRDWAVQGTEGYKSAREARESVERVYPGVSYLWVDAHVTEQQAGKHLEEIWGGQRCNFCGRTSLELDPMRMIEKNGSWIC